MMRQVLFLDDLLHVGRSSVGLGRTEGSSDSEDERVAPSRSMLSLASEEALWVPPSCSCLSLDSQGVPRKNTFIHFDIVKSPHPRPPSPTPSAPDRMLSGLFKLASDTDCASDAGNTTHTPLSSLWSESELGFSSVCDSKTTVATQTDDLCAEAEASFPSHVAASHVNVGADTRANSTVSISFAVVEKHRLGQCTPCNYFWSKVDGCRLGADCSFCHFCPKGEVKKRKKDKVRQTRKAGVELRKAGSIHK